MVAVSVASWRGATESNINSEQESTLNTPGSDAPNIRPRFHLTFRCVKRGFRLINLPGLGLAFLLVWLGLTYIRTVSPRRSPKGDG
jgi:hypothetical protein